MVRQHTQQPITTGSSVVAIKYKDGIVMGSDMMVAYGSQLRFPDTCRQKVVGKHTVVGATGEYSDFQEISKFLDEAELNDFLHADGSEMGPKQIASYVGRRMYQARSKFDPLYNQLVIGGVDPMTKESYLHYADHQGTTYEENYIATGFAMHLGLPILRESYKPDLTLEEAKAVVQKCLTLMFYRDCKASCKVQFSVVSKTSPAETLEPFVLPTFWKHPTWMKTQKELSHGLGASW